MDLEKIKEHVINLINCENTFKNDTPSEHELTLLILYCLIKDNGFVFLSKTKLPENNLFKNGNDWRVGGKVHQFFFILENYPNLICKFHGYLILNKFHIINISLKYSMESPKKSLQFSYEPSNYLHKIEMPFGKKLLKNFSDLCWNFNKTIIYPIKQFILEIYNENFFLGFEYFLLEESTDQVIPKNLYDFVKDTQINKYNLFVILMVILTLECGFNLEEDESWDLNSEIKISKINFYLKKAHHQVEMILMPFNDDIIVTMYWKNDSKFITSYSHKFAIDKYIDTKPEKILNECKSLDSKIKFTPKMLKDCKSLSIEFKDNLANNVKIEILNKFPVVNASLQGMPPIILHKIGNMLDFMSQVQLRLALPQFDFYFTT